jgi:transposase
MRSVSICYERCSKRRSASSSMPKEKTERQRARQHLVAAMLAGQSWQQIARAEALPLKRAMAYRLVHAVRTRGDGALADGRHGHPSKLRGEAQAFLEEQCRQAPFTPSSTLQVKLRERFDLSVSISQINRLRAALGVSNRPQNQEQGKNRSKRGPFISTRMAGRR